MTIILSQIEFGFYRELSVRERLLNMTFNCGQILRRTGNILYACKECLWEIFTNKRPALIENIKKFLQFYCCLCCHYYKRTKSIDDIEINNEKNCIKVNYPEKKKIESKETLNTPIISLENMDEM